jgi:hypothetical protein
VKSKRTSCYLSALIIRNNINNESIKMVGGTRSNNHSTTIIPSSEPIGSAGVEPTPMSGVQPGEGASGGQDPGTGPEPAERTAAEQAAHNREIKKRHKQLKDQVEMRRMEREIAEMNQELADDTGEFHAIVDGVAYAVRKRPVSQSAEQAYRPQPPRAKKPSTYHAKNMQELTMTLAV